MQDLQAHQIREQVQRYLRKRCPPQEVEDVVQDCLYRVLVAEAHGLDITPELVHHICHAVWVDWLRKQERRAEMEMALEGDCACITWEAQLLLSIDVGACLQSLTASERDLVQRHYIDGETCASIGSRLGISEQAVKKRLQRLKQKLRNLLADYGGGYINAT
ncbi:MAG: RNA polymerase sigma factor [Armatimonadota bacterium]